MTTIEKRAEELYNLTNTIKMLVLQAQMGILEAEEGNLSIKEASFIMLLGETGRCKMSGLAEKMGLAYSTMTGLADKLVKLGYIQRRRIEEDRRVVMVELTEQGVSFKNWLHEQSAKIFTYLLNFLNEEEQETLIALYRKIHKNVMADRAHGGKQ
ncbi:MarR family winged helix-turn-helix transcriptional regulator [candidate division KSB1 bacterium]